MNMTDRVRVTNLVLFVVTCAIALIVWAWTALKGSAVSLESLLPLIGPQTAAIGLGELSNVGKRATAKAEVIEAEVKAKNGG